MQSIIHAVEQKYRKSQVVDVRSGDTVRIHQRIKEGSKERIQVFEGLIIRTRRKGSLTSTITARRIASGVGVEKTFLLHSPLVEKVEVIKRSKVRRKYLSYMRERGGKSARLAAVNFDKESVNKPNIPVDTTEEAKAAEAALEQDEAPKEEAVTEAKAADKTEVTEVAAAPSEEKAA
jgi:large subunit ribosomal protein L19